MKDHIETNEITSVSESDEWFSVRCGSLGLGVKKKYGITPKIGDTITIYSKNIFGIIRGIDINGQSLFYKTDEELEAHRIRESEKYKQKQIDDFEKNKSNLDAQYSDLPQIFKDRIDRFRVNNPNFRVEFESYEMFCCTEALKIAEALKTVSEVKSFYEKPFDQQIKLVPTLDNGHSGNTFGCACQLAGIYLEAPEYISKVHGSLSALVGSEAFGDIENTEATQSGN